MYESHFGLSAPPFQLNPDPAFYFGSRGHANALAYLKFGIYQGEGFIVVTGEIGAGKTTLVRTLLETLDSDKVVAAQVVSTQLASEDLLRAILNAYGVPGPRENKAQMLGLVEAFLTTLAAQGKRALLVVDEAQNLPLDTIEELRMLSNFQIGHQALLQSFLVGQPELRAQLESPQMEQLRQRVIASCHLGPLDLAETQAYVEHRLHHVGWTDRPRFEPAAFEEIQRWSAGIPRRINLLCSRVMLATFLSGDEVVTGAAVARVGAELRGEVGASTQEFSPASRGAPMASAARTPLPAAGLPPSALAMPAAPAFPAPVSVQPQAGASPRLLEWRARPASVAGPWLCLVDGPLGRLGAARLGEALAAEGLRPAWQVLDLGETPPPFDLDGLPGAGLAPWRQPGPAVDAAAVDELLAELDPSAVLLLGQSPALRLAAQRAALHQVAVVRLDAGLRSGEADAVSDQCARQLDHLAQLLCVAQTPVPSPALQREGVGAARVIAAGSVALDTLAALQPRLPDTAALLRAAGGAAAPVARGHGLVGLHLDAATPEPLVQRWFDTLSVLAADTPLVWPMDAATRDRLDACGLLPRLAESGITAVQGAGFAARVALLAQSAWLVHDTRADLQDVALAWDLPSLEILPRRPTAAGVSHGRHAQGPMAAAPVLRWAREAARLERRALPGTAPVLRRLAAELVRRQAAGPLLAPSAEDGLQKAG